MAVISRRKRGLRSFLSLSGKEEKTKMVEIVEGRNFLLLSTKTGATKHLLLSPSLLASRPCSFSLHLSLVLCPSQRCQASETSSRTSRRGAFGEQLSGALAEKHDREDGKKRSAIVVRRLMPLRFYCLQLASMHAHPSPHRPRERRAR